MTSTIISVLATTSYNVCSKGHVFSFAIWIIYLKTMKVFCIPSPWWLVLS